LATSSCGQDSMLVWDRTKRRLTMIGPSGVIARQFEPISVTQFPNSDIVCTSNGLIAFISDEQPGMKEVDGVRDAFVSTTDVAVLNRDGQRLASRDSVRGGEWVRVQSASGGLGFTRRPLGFSTQLASSGNTIVLAYTDSASLLVFPELPAVPNGRFSLGSPSRARLALPARNPCPADLASAARAITSRIEDQPSADAAYNEIIRKPLPAKTPLYYEMLADTDGLLWLQTSVPGGKSQSYTVVTRTGQIAAKVQLPQPLIVFQIGRDFILGAYTDESDLWHTVEYRLDRE
jgi:hypothetical protein